MNKLRAYPNNNLSDKFAAKDISDGSLNQITTTGFYFGSNITEVTPYIKSHKWCLINAYVSGNSASIFVTAGDAMALSIYRNGDGIYSYYPIATKSDLPKYDIKTFTVDVTTQNANSNGKYYTDKKLSTESWYSSAKAIVPLFARKSGGAYICMVEIEYGTLRVQADIAISGVTVGILVVS